LTEAHQGDLRAALVDSAVELIGERGLRGFSMAEASRRLGVAVSAPCRPVPPWRGHHHQRSM